MVGKLAQCALVGFRRPPPFFAPIRISEKDGPGVLDYTHPVSSRARKNIIARKIGAWLKGACVYSIKNLAHVPSMETALERNLM